MKMSRQSIELVFLIALLIKTSCSGIRTLDVTDEDGCKVTEPMYNTTFNLNKLKFDLGHLVKLSHLSKIEFNICGKLTKKCAGKPDVAACLTHKSQEHILGMQAVLKLSNGLLHLIYKGEKCTENNNYSLGISLKCDYDSTQEPISIDENENDCAHYIEYRTSYACLKLADLASDECTITTDNEHVINLKALSNINHYVENRITKSHFLINICRPVLYGQNAICAPNSGICFIDKDEKELDKKYLNYGISSTKFGYENKTVIMRFRSEEKCEKSTNFSSIIYFVCEASSTVENVEYIGLNGCEHQFSWYTSYVCEKTEPCVAVAPRSGIKYDLRSLSGNSYKVSEENETYVFGVCQSPKNSCLETSGACSVSGHSTSLGIINNKLLFDSDQSGLPYLLYKRGAICSDNAKSTWSTKIEFVCADKNMTVGPKIIENTNCKFVIQFVTEAVCQNQQTLCQTTNASDGSVVDLSPLIRTTENYVARVNDSLKESESDKVKFFINVCRPLVPQYGLNCGGGSAACRAIMENEKAEKEQSLGYSYVTLTMVNTISGPRPQLKYFQGDICPADHSTQLSTLIEFFCDPKAGFGDPILQSIINDCEYKFDWATNVICPKNSCDFNKDSCSIYNEPVSATFFLKDVTENGLINIKADNRSFDVNLCDGQKDIIVDYSQKLVNVFLTTNITCGKNADNIRLELRLICTNENTIPAAIFSDGPNNCHFVKTLETRAVCPLMGIIVPEEVPSSASTTTQSPDANREENVNPSDGSGVSAIGAVCIAIGLLCSIVAAIIILKKPERREKIKSLFRRKTVSVSYSRVQSNEATNLLMLPAGLSDSDDELLI